MIHLEDEDKEYYYIQQISPNLTLVQPEENGKFHYIKEDGTRLNDEEYEFAENFFCDRALVRPGLPEPYYPKGKRHYYKLTSYHYIKPDGTKLNDKYYHNAKPFSCSLAAVQLKKNTKWHYIKPDGTKLNDEYYYDAKNFSCDLAAVQLEKDTKWHYIKSDGTQLYNEALRHYEILFGDGTYYDAKPFSYGLAVVQPEAHDTYHLIKEMGNRLDYHEYRKINSFSCGLALVYNGCFFYYIETNGARLNYHEYYHAENFQNNIASVKLFIPGLCVESSEIRRYLREYVTKNFPTASLRVDPSDLKRYIHITKKSCAFYSTEDHFNIRKGAFFIRTDGTQINTEEYYDIKRFSIHQVLLKPHKNSDWYYFDLNTYINKIIIPKAKFCYDIKYSFGKKQALVQLNKNDNWYYIDSDDTRVDSQECFCISNKDYNFSDYYDNDDDYDNDYSSS